MSGPMLLPYTYLNATILVGGLNMLPGAADLTLVEMPAMRILLTGDANRHLLEIDRAMAFANVQLGVENVVGSRDEQVVNELNKIQSSRATRVGGRAVLLFAAQGEENVTITDSLREHSDFLTVRNGFPRGLLSGRYSEKLDSIKAAISLEISTLDHFEPLAEGTFFQWPDGRPLYSYTFTVAGRGTIAQSATQGNASTISARFAALASTATSQSAQRLVARMAEEPSDKLRQFVFGWIALEIFVNQSFARHGRTVIDAMANDGASGVGARLVKHGQHSVNDGYSLVGRFMIAAAALFPAASEEEQEADLATFKMVKRTRDDLFHGEDVQEEALPVSELQRLQRALIGRG
jgi:hypothetical protein